MIAYKFMDLLFPFPRNFWIISYLQTKYTKNKNFQVKLVKADTYTVTKFLTILK